MCVKPLVSLSMQSEKSCFLPLAAFPLQQHTALQVLFASMKVEDLCVNPEAPHLSPRNKARSQ